ncbi:TonB-dependent receptor [Granulicella sp. 5B5]|uniref:TonB-dependent receptor n=1 Tax=Granulicella sp. 5B5 TaxID=1617967 RepID=UPI0015F44342|nr:TonB-dependent receptor [Granulicella sp. 5B5]
MCTLPALAQQTGISGVVTDAQGGGLPGAKVEVKKTGGGTFLTTANGQGTYVVPNLTAAEYTISASAPGFATVERKVELLVGQLAQINVSLPLASTSTAVVVEATSDLAIDTTSSAVAGNVTPKEVQDVPINGRNYVELSALVPGIKANSFGNTPAASGQSTNAGDAETGKFQITMDGLQVSQDSVGSSFGQPKFSQDAISQFQIITDRFDATSGRSAGIYVNVQTKTGTNSMHGGAFGYFRNSFFNASDPIAKKVLDFSDQQYGGTLGGAIKRDKLWYFGSYEGEHQPNTATISPYVTTTAGALFSHATIFKVNEYLGRVDYQMNDKNHFFLRGDGFTQKSSFVAGSDPSQSYSSSVSSSGFVADWNRSLSDHLINDLHGGFHYFQFQNLPFFSTGSIQVSLPGGVTVGEPYNEPEVFDQYSQQYRDDLFWLKGKHSVKMGGEYLFTKHGGQFPQYLRGGLTCSGVTASQSLYNQFFPNGTLDPSTWNYALLNQDCTSTSYIQAFGQYNIDIDRNIIGVWAQDDWKILPKLTLNLGLRYDNDLGAYNTGYKPTPGLLTPNTNPNLNFGPRLGFSYDPRGDGKTSIRGGAGLYYADQVANPIIDEELYSSTARALQATVAGSPSTPLSLPTPFTGQNPSSNPDGYVNTPQPVARGSKTPYALQASIGGAHEFGSKTAVTADFVHMRVYDDFILLSANILENPANAEQNLIPTAPITAANYASRVCGNGDITLDSVTNLATGAPNNGNPNASPALNVCNNLFGTGTRTFTTYPGAGVIADDLQIGVKHATTKGFTGAVAYTWGRTKNSTGGQFSYPNKPFRPGIQQEWANGTDDQRHTLTMNGEYQWKYGLSLSSLYHFGSGLAFAPTSGGSVNGYTGSTRTFGYSVANGQSLLSQPIAPGATCPVAHCTTIYAPLSKVSYDANYGYWVIQRDGFRGTKYNRVDARLQENFTIKEKYHAIVAVEAFNLFNHANYGNFATAATTGTGANAYGTPIASSGAPFEYQARSLQFIGRFSF